MVDKHIGSVKTIFRYPVKSMQGEQVETAEVTPSGLKGDRAYALRLANGRIATAKRTTALLNYAAHYEGDTVMIRLPSGEVAAADDPAVNAQLSASLGTSVTLEPRQENQQSFGELDADTIFAGIPVQEALEGKKRQLPSGATDYSLAQGSFYDSAHLHLLATGTLAHLDQLLDGESELDVCRFRPNILIETAEGLRGFIEDEWVDGQLMIGDVAIGEIWPTLRCVMTTLPQGGLPKDTRILHKIVKAHENHLGVFATALQCGRIQVGDPVKLVN